MQPLEDVPDQVKPVPSPSVVVTRVVPLILAAQILLTLVIYPFLPNTVPSHWNAAGQVDSYEAKWVFAGFLPVFSLFLYIMFAALFTFSRSLAITLDRRAQQSANAKKMILKFVMLMQQVLFLIIQAILLLIALHAGSGAVR